MVRRLGTAETAGANEPGGCSGERPPGFVVSHQHGAKSAARMRAVRQAAGMSRVCRGANPPSQSPRASLTFSSTLVCPGA